MSQLDQFRGAAAVTAAFNEDSPVGATVSGTVTEVDVRQRIDYKTKEALYFKDGKPKQQVQITVQTGAGDDGLRRIYVKMDYRSDREALLAAVDASGDDDVRVGGKFAAQYLGYGTDESTGKPAGWKVYRYEYQPPSALAAAAGITQQPSPELPPQGMSLTIPRLTPQAAAPAAAAPAAAAPLDVAGVRALIAAGVDDATIVQVHPLASPVLLAALRNTSA